MIYRISIILPRDDDPELSPAERMEAIASVGWSLEAVLCMEALGLPAPRRFTNPRARFYFTELGWAQIGRHVLVELGKHQYQARITSRKDPRKSEVAYWDLYQVAILPRASRKRQPRRKRDR